MIKSLCGLVLLCAAFAASALSYPTKPNWLIVPFAAGGGIDLAARVVAAAVSERIGQPVVIENHAGAGGIIGIEVAAKTAPDGDTFVIGSTTTMAANLFLYRNIPFDPLKDFKALLAALKPPEMAEKIRDTGFVSTPADAESLSATHRADIARLGKLVKEAGIKAE